MHLGVPRGSIEYQRAAFDAQLDKKEIATRKISALDKVQDQWVLLNWVTKHKFTYLLRHVTPLITHENLGRIDHILRTSFCHIGGHAIDDLAWNQAQLPIGLGGFGLGFIRNSYCRLYRKHVRNQIRSYRQSPLSPEPPFSSQRRRARTLRSRRRR